MLSCPSCERLLLVPYTCDSVVFVHHIRVPLPKLRTSPKYMRDLQKLQFSGRTWLCCRTSSHHPHPIRVIQVHTCLRRTGWTSATETPWATPPDWHYMYGSQWYQGGRKSIFKTMCMYAIRQKNSRSMRTAVVFRDERLCLGKLENRSWLIIHLGDLLSLLCRPRSLSAY